MKKKPQNTGLKNPSVVAAAATPEGKQAITAAATAQLKVAEKGVDLIFWAVKWIAIGGAIFYIINTFAKKFTKLQYDRSLDPANITPGEAASRASRLLKAMKGFGANVDEVGAALAGLNHNAWILVYNTFGLQQSSVPGTDPMNLSEWILDQFSGDDLDTLRMILPDEF